MVFPIKNSNTSLGKYVKKSSAETLFYHNHRSYMTFEKFCIHLFVIMCGLLRTSEYLLGDKQFWEKYSFTARNPAGNYMFKVNNRNTRTR